MGAGIVGYGEWIDAILQLWVQCRGDVGQLIQCHGLHYVLAPEITIYVMAPGTRSDPMDTSESPYLLTPDLFLGRSQDGWRYRAPAPGEYGRWKPLEAYPTRGPFATAEEAAHDALGTLELSHTARGLPEMIATMGPDTEMGRAIQVLHEGLRLRH